MKLKKEIMKEKWSAVEDQAVCCGVGSYIKAQKGFFYILGSYTPESFFGAKPVLSIRCFEDFYDAFAFYVFKGIPSFLETAESEAAKKMRGIAGKMEVFLDDEKYPAESILEEIRQDMNQVSGQSRHNMPFIEMWGGLNSIMRSEAVKERLLYKRVRLKNTVLKALIDVNKFDENNEKHCRLAEKFLENIG
ncbi:MAG TPA: hypothetical protein ENN55_04900 [Firmicutes bacterium]|nr:hypothetical protein [Bacillota bacterium]